MWEACICEAPCDHSCPHCWDDEATVVDCPAGQTQVVHAQPAKFAPKAPVSWSARDGRNEWHCTHADGSKGPGHGNHIHGCDGCCSHESFPGKVRA